jgi:hypothetical protein
METLIAVGFGLWVCHLLSKDNRPADNVDIRIRIKPRKKSLWESFWD